MSNNNTLWILQGNHESFSYYTVRKGWEETNRSICPYCEHSSERYFGPLIVEWDKGHVHDYDIMLGIGGHIVVKRQLYDKYFKEISYLIGSVKFIGANGKILPGSEHYVEVQFPIISECAIDIKSSTAKIEICRHCGSTTKFKIVGVESVSNKYNMVKKSEMVRRHKIMKDHGLIIHRQFVKNTHGFQLRCAFALFCSDSVRERLTQMKVNGLEFLQYGLIR